MIGPEYELLTRLRSSDPQERHAAAAYAGMHPAQADTEAVVADLSHIVEQDEWQPAREWAVWALGEIGNKAAIPMLRNHLDDSNRDVRVHCALSLGRLGCVEVVPTLTNIIVEGSDEVLRRFAVTALCSIAYEPDAMVALRQINASGATPPGLRQSMYRALHMVAPDHPRGEGAGVAVDIPLFCVPCSTPTSLPDECAQAARMTVSLVRRRERDQEPIARLKRRYDHTCQVCSRPGFETRQGDRYAEVHHIVRLADGGADADTNMLVVCALCHRELHFARDLRYDPDPRAGHRPLTVTVSGYARQIRWVDDC